jgi:hypothetical protein
MRPLERPEAAKKMITAHEHSGGGKAIGQPAHKKPFRKASAHVVQERIEFVAELIANGSNSREIRLAIKKVHRIEWRQSAEYLTRAKEYLLTKAAGMTKQQALAEAIQFYSRIIADKKADTRDRLTARIRLDCIFGLDAPRPRWQPELPPAATPADDAARALDSGMLSALELVYGADAKQEVINITARQLPAPSADTKPDKRHKMKLA